MDKIVYHGSPNGDIQELVANRSTHQKKCIYATDNKAIAMMFMGKGKGDLDTVIAVEDGIPVLVERRAGVLDMLYNKPGYMYELDGSTFEHYDFLWSPEVISFEESIKPLRVTYYESVMDALCVEEQLGRIVIYRYPDRPLEIPLDNSDLIDKYISFQERGIEGAIASLLEVYPEFSDIVKERLQEKEGRKLK